MNLQVSVFCLFVISYIHSCILYYSIALISCFQSDGSDDSPSAASRSRDVLGLPAPAVATWTSHATTEQPPSYTAQESEWRHPCIMETPSAVASDREQGGHLPPPGSTTGAKQYFALAEITQYQTGLHFAIQVIPKFEIYSRNCLIQTLYNSISFQSRVMNLMVNS